MRIRKSFAAAFALLLLISAYLGLSPIHIEVVNDKVLHFLTFLVLTLCFYWILETSRRRVLNLTLVICTFGLGIGSEVIQHFVPNGRTFDPYDILANLVGSLLAIAICSWYHKRMLERKRASRQFLRMPGDEGDERDPDVELGENIGGQETGVVDVEEELQNWNENEADDGWDEDQRLVAESGSGEGQKASTSSTGA